MYTLPKIERFNQNVLSKYHIYNSVFITLPFDAIDNTGVMLPLFSEVCSTGFKNNLTPVEIVNSFSKKYLDSVTEEEKISLLFRFIQYVERQIVLFDAIEDAAFPVVNNMEGKASLRDVKERADTKELQEELVSFLENFNIRTVLTAHPTQFYPGSVLGIITDLTDAVRDNDLTKIKELLAQLGKTPFIRFEVLPQRMVSTYTADARSHRLMLQKSTKDLAFFGSMGGYFPTLNAAIWGKTIQFSVGASTHLSLKRYVHHGEVLNVDFFADFLADLQMNNKSP